MKLFLKRVNSLPLVHVWLFLIVFFLPFQKPYKKWIQSLSSLAFKNESLSPFFYDRHLYYFLGDFLMVGFILCALFSIRTPLRTLLWKQSGKYLLLFFSFALVSIFCSESSHALWPYLRLLHFSLPLFLCLALRNRRDREMIIKVSFGILLTVGLCQVFIACGQYFLQHSMGFSGLGERKLYLDEAPSFLMGEKRRWIFDNLLGTHSPSSLILRAHGTFKHPNILGAFLGMTLFASSYLFLQAKTKGTKLLSGLSIPLQIFGLTLSYSRAAILGVFSLSLFYFVWLLCQKKWRKQTSLLICLFVFGGAATGTLLHQQLLERGGVINYNEYVKEASDDGRMAYYKVGLKMAKARPFIGHGFQQYENAIVPFLTGHESYHIQKVHNIYFLLLVETGILGLGAFLAFLGSRIFWVLKSGLDIMQVTLMLILLFFLLSGCVDHFIFTSYQGSLMLFLVIGLLGLKGKPQPQIPSSSQKL